MQDAGGCFYEASGTTCGAHQACAGAAGAAQCACAADPVCSSAGTACATSSSLTTCAQSGSCFYQGPATSCGTGTVCERVAPASCQDPAWAEWPVPPSTSPTAYTDNGDGTVTDKITGLMWQQSSAPSTMTQAAALTYCSTMLTAGGHSDWRLPTKIELLSILDYAKASGPTINAIFTITQANWYWTATTFALDTSQAWFVSFIDCSTSAEAMSSAAAVRCVR